MLGHAYGGSSLSGCKLTGQKLPHAVCVPSIDAPNVTARTCVKTVCGVACSHLKCGWDVPPLHLDLLPMVNMGSERPMANKHTGLA